MTTSEILTIIALLVSPAIAVEIQILRQKLGAARESKSRIFHTLMAHRANRISLKYVEALNLIDLEFTHRGKFSLASTRRQDKVVVEKWHDLLDHLNEPIPTDPAQQGQEPSPDVLAQQRAWSEKNDTLSIDLLFEMSKALGYSFERTQIKKGWYSPSGHFDVSTDEQTIRKGFAALFKGNFAVPVVPANELEVTDEEREARRATEEKFRAQRDRMVEAETAYYLEALAALRERRTSPAEPPKGLSTTILEPPADDAAAKN